MIKIIVTFLSLVVMLKNDVWSMDSSETSHKEALLSPAGPAQHQHYENKYTLLELGRFINSYPHKEKVFRELQKNDVMRYELGKIPVEYFLEHVHDISTLRFPKSDFLEQIKKTEGSCCLFLAIAKIELGLENPNFEKLAKRYQLDKDEIVSNAETFGLKSFDYDFHTLPGAVLLREYGFQKKELFNLANRFDMLTLRPQILPVMTKDCACHRRA
ncbi:hypothetical protein [Candidatus Finniella inopinata]|uniref:Uncharacterized protein n=1 Tax=Candidatus Finniella inopinata TaxID=1696036 RepID=A0A4Q7DNG1_9PROT|nr:hypothetical protein [Candidatus Finniella inopinata]RZI46406.1 hypothetical protein EQU50_02100 [Candidatus Finniella inopinata]